MIRENAETLAREHELAGKIELVWQARLVKQPRLFRLDYAIVKGGKVVGFAELKDRKNKHDLYPTYMISASKILRAVELKTTTGLDTVIAVRFSDKDFYHKVAKSDGYEYKIGGRLDRDDENDMEVVAHIPMSSFFEL